MAKKRKKGGRYTPPTSSVIRWMEEDPQWDDGCALDAPAGVHVLDENFVVFDLTSLADAGDVFDAMRAACPVCQDDEH